MGTYARTAGNTTQPSTTATSHQIDNQIGHQIGRQANPDRQHWRPRRYPDESLAWVSIGDAADIAEFAVASIRSWWCQIGRDRFPDAIRLLITADAWGSDGYRIRA